MHIHTPPSERCKVTWYHTDSPTKWQSFFESSTVFLRASMHFMPSHPPPPLFFNCHVIPESVRPVINCLLELHFLYSFITLAEMCSQCHVTVSRMWAQQSRLICSPALDPQRQPTLPDVPIKSRGTSSQNVGQGDKWQWNGGQMT